MTKVIFDNDFIEELKVKYKTLVDERSADCWTLTKQQQQEVLDKFADLSMKIDDIAAQYFVGDSTIRTVWAKYGLSRNELLKSVGIKNARAYASMKVRPQDKIEISRMHKAGYSKAVIKQYFNISYETVNRVLREFECETNK